MSLQTLPIDDFPFPERYKYLTVAAYERAEIGDSDLGALPAVRYRDGPRDRGHGTFQPGNRFHGPAELAPARLQQVAVGRDYLNSTRARHAGCRHRRMLLD